MKNAANKGYTLIELIITVTVLAILTLTAVPLAQNAVKREKEQRLRDTLREIRSAIDEFKRDTIGACINQAGLPPPSDPRSRVFISDCKIFEVENVDRYPPSLQLLVDGVDVKPRGVPLGGGTSGGGSAFGKGNGSDLNQLKEQKKHYLREIPVDPLTGKNDTWILRSSYQEKDGAWDEINVFDVRSGAEGEALNGDKYSDW